MVKIVIMDKKIVKYIYFDLDGTLLNSAKKITRESIETIRKVKEKGIKIGIISGRPDYMIKKEIDLIKPDLPTISMNGAKITSCKNDQISFDSLTNNDQKKLANYLIKEQITFLAYGFRTMYYYLPHQTASQWVSNIKLEIQKRKIAHKWNLKRYDFCNEKIGKFLLIFENQAQTKETAILNYIKNTTACYAVKSQSIVLDIMVKNVSKGEALKKLDQMHQLALKNTMVFGDANNDLSMFENSKYAVAMKNATKLVQAKASQITKFTNDENGVASFLESEFL